MNSTFDSLREQVMRIADEELPGRFIDCASSAKADGSLLTEADLVMQRRLQTLLRKATPDHAFLGEEMTASEQAARLADPGPGVWVLDPLDGTSNFAGDIPLFCVSLALIRAGRVELGLVYDPLRRECFYAERGAGAGLNGQRLHPPERRWQLERCTAMVDFKRLGADLATRLVTAAPFGSQRNFGSVALELCWLAAGRGQLYLHGGQKLWDHAAALLILHEAGGHSITLEGERAPPLGLAPRSTVAALDPELFRQWCGWLGVPATD
jgi:myo-inositol-1(or 4)-monophosphatase